jgi:hypothetical protein
MELSLPSLITNVMAGVVVTVLILQRSEVESPFSVLEGRNPTVRVVRSQVVDIVKSTLGEHTATSDCCDAHGHIAADSVINVGDFVHEGNFNGSVFVDGEDLSAVVDRSVIDRCHVDEGVVLGNTNKPSVSRTWNFNEARGAVVGLLKALSAGTK